MNTHLIILILSLVGVATSIYLFIQRKKKRPPVCVIGGSCATVWESPYSVTFGIGNEILGLIFYSMVAIIEWAIIGGCAYVLNGPFELIVLIAGALMSCYFIYLEWRVIRAWCFWCTISAIISWLMLAVFLLV